MMRHTGSIKRERERERKGKTTAAAAASRDAHPASHRPVASFNFIEKQQQQQHQWRERSVSFFASPFSQTDEAPFYFVASRGKLLLPMFCV